MKIDKLQEKFNIYMPLNRKERFFSGTVLPQIICGGNYELTFLSS